MRRRLLAALSASALLSGVAVVALGPGPAAAGAPCGSGQVEVRGTVRDAATRLPLQEVTSVGIEQLDGDFEDGDGTDASSRWTACIPAGEYQFTFAADSYRVDQAAGVQRTIEAPGPVVINVFLTPRGRVLAGQVTNMNGARRTASIGIYRQAPGGRWVALDGIGNFNPRGAWSYRVPSYGRYKVNACVDNHWCQWATSANRRSRSRTITVGPSTTFIDNVHVRVPFCRRSPPDFCVPWGYNS